MKDKILKNKKLINYIILITVGLIICIPLLKNNIDVYYDDGIQHIARAYGTFESIKQNKIFPNVISMFSNNFGYSWNLFYGSISTYGIIIFKLIFGTYIVGYKIFLLVCLILSGIFMYKFCYNLTKNNNIALLAGILYMVFPYHLTDMYTRNALGEFVSFVFIPLVFLGLYNLFYTTENNYYLAIGAIALVLTHNISTAVIAFLALVYSIFNLEKLAETNVKKSLLINIVFIIFITSFYWGPFLETTLFTEYQVYEAGMMATKESTQDAGLYIKQLFATTNESEFVFELGIYIIIMLAFSVMTFRRLDTELKEQYIFFLIMGIVSLWMSTRYFPWKFLLEQFCIIQFPWRMLMVSAFCFSIICAINMNVIIKKFNLKDVIIISMISIIYILAFFNTLIKYNEEPLQNIENLNLGMFSGKEYEVIAGAGRGEYLPEKAYKNRFYLATRQDYIYVLEGNAEITNEVKNGTNYIADIKSYDSEYVILELPYLYYPGYEIRLDGSKTESFETENGFIGIAISPMDNVHMEVNYRATKVMKLSMCVSVISLITFAIYILKKH